MKHPTKYTSADVRDLCTELRGIATLPIDEGIQNIVLEAASVLMHRETEIQSLRVNLDRSFPRLDSQAMLDTTLHVTSD